MSYLQRYIDGEYEQVWNDLFLLGPAVRSEAQYPDIYAVVQETMRRVRHNIEYLIPRLVQIGYVFGYDHVINYHLRRPLSGSDWQNQYLDVMHEIHTQPPIFLPARLNEELHAELRDIELEDLTADIVPDALYPDMADYIHELNLIIGPVPLALRAWYEQVGAVNFFGYHPRWVQFLDQPSLRMKDIPEAERGRYLMSACDPFQVCVLDAHYRDKLIRLQEQHKLTAFEFAPDPFFKDLTGGSSTPYVIQLGQAGIDGTLADPSLTFMAYVRKSLRWAGFPGMAEWESAPLEDIAFVTQDMLPF